MGKVKVRVVGDESAEQEQKNQQKKKRQEKNQAKGLNMGGGQRINTVGVSEEDIAKEITQSKQTEQIDETKSRDTRGTPDTLDTPTKKARGKKQRAKEERKRSKRHTTNESLVAKKTDYPISSGIEILRKFKKSNFDETVELHINVKEKGVSGVVALPHGTGKKVRIKVVDDAAIAEIEKGKIDFDVLIAAPDMMPKLAKVARVLGPKGLMPNPKAGTITDKPEALIEKLSAGQISYKTETQAPLIHLTVGKLSFTDKQLLENVDTILKSIGAEKIDAVTLKSSMSPAVKLKVA